MRLLLLFAAVFSVSVHAQRILEPSGVFSDGKVIIRFTIAKGAQCNGFSVYHTADSTLPFVYAGGDPGLCGDFNYDDPKSYTHDNPAVNQMNFYQVRLEGEISQTIRVFGAGSQPGLFIYPNPLTSNDGEIKIKVLNTSNTRLVGYLYNRYGRVVSEPDIVSTGGKAILRLGSLEEGVYILWLTDGFNVFSGKFIVVR